MSQRRTSLPSKSFRSTNIVNKKPMPARGAITKSPSVSTMDTIREKKRIMLSSNAKNIVQTETGIWCGCKEGTLHVLDEISGSLTSKIEGPTYAGSSGPSKLDVTSIALIDGFVWTGSSEGQIRLWNVETFQLHRELQGHTGAVCVIATTPSTHSQYTSSQRHVFTGSYDWTIRVWNASGAFVRQLLGHSSWVRCLLYDNETEILWSGGDEGVIRRWDIHSDQADSLSIIHAHAKGVMSLASINSQIWSGSVDGVIKIWNNEAEAVSIFQAHKGWVCCLLPVADTVWTGSTDKSIRIWSLNGKLLKTISMGQYIGSINRWSSGDIWVTMNDKSVRIYEISSVKLRERISKFERKKEEEFSAHQRHIEQQRIEQKESDWQQQMASLSQRHHQELDKAKANLRRCQSSSLLQSKRIEELEALVVSLKAEIGHLESLLIVKEEENDDLVFQIAQSPINTDIKDFLPSGEGEDDESFLTRSLGSLEAISSPAMIGQQAKIETLQAELRQLQIDHSPCHLMITSLREKKDALEQQIEDRKILIDREGDNSRLLETARAELEVFKTRETNLLLKQEESVQQLTSIREELGTMEKTLFYNQENSTSLLQDMQRELEDYKERERNLLDKDKESTLLLENIRKELEDCKEKEEEKEKRRDLLEENQQEQIFSLQQEVASWKKSMEDGEKEMRKCQHKLELTSTENENLKKMNENEASTVTKTLLQLQVANQQLFQEKQDLQLHQDLIGKENEENIAILQSTTEQRNQLVQENAKHVDDISLLNKAIEENQDTLHSFSQEIEEIRKMNNILLEGKKVQTKELERSSLDLAELAEHCSTLESENKDLKELSEKIRVNMSELVAEKEEKELNLVNSISALQRELEETHSRKTSTQEENKKKHLEEITDLQQQLKNMEENHRSQLNTHLSSIRAQLSLQYQSEVKQMKELLLQKDKEIRAREETLSQQYDDKLREQKLILDDTYRDTLEDSKTTLNLYKRKLASVKEDFRHISLWLVKSMDDVNENEPPTIVKAGFMFKRGDRVKNWKRRLFILRNDGGVVYYAQKDCPKPRGIIYLQDLTALKQSSGNADYPDSLDLHTESRVWNLHFDSDQVKDSWTEVIRHYQTQRNSIRQ